MKVEFNTPIVTPALGDDVAKEVLQWIGAFRLLTKATIISYNMQDYDFWGNGLLSNLLIRTACLWRSYHCHDDTPTGNQWEERAI